jgi:hypothetical protein
MSDVYLQGSESVSHAGSQMANAASEITQAVNNMSARLDQFERFMQEWLERLEQVKP